MPTLYVLRGPDKGRTFDPPSCPVVLGRQSTHVPLTDNTASREHAIMSPEGEGWIIEDMGSSNGTYINGQRIVGPTRLEHGDQIKIGGTLMAFGADDSVERFSGESITPNIVEYSTAGGSARRMDSSILSAIPSCEDSVILATPETAEAVHAWKLMYQIADALGSFGAVEDFLERVADLICQHFVFDRMLILMGEPSDEEFTPQVVRFRGEDATGQPRVTASRTIINHIRETKNGILCADAMTDQRFGGRERSASVIGLGLRTVLCVPIITHGEVHGIIHIGCSMSQATYSQEQLRLATAVGRMVGMALENNRLLESRVRTERLAATGETVAYLSHHIRNILQGLHSGSDVLEMGIERRNFETIEMAWGIIQRNLDRTLHLATNMLTFSKDRDPSLEVGDLNHVVEDALALCRRPAEDHGVGLTTELAEMTPVPLDKEGIHQVVLNLVLNAIEACPSEGGEVVVSTDYDAEKHVAVVTVRDNGPGIDPVDLPHVFEPFQSTKGQGGTGLGLAASKKIMNECRGELRVQAAPDKGAVFTVIIPTGETDMPDAERTITS